MAMNKFLDNAEFMQLVAEIRAVYEGAIPNQFAASIWYRALKDIPYRTLCAAWELHVQSSPHSPKPSDLRKCAEQIAKNTAEGIPTFEEVWQRITRALRNSSYHADEEFAKLPEAAQEVVVSPENLQKWAVMDVSELDTVQKSLSRRIYDTMASRKASNAKLSGRMRNMLDTAKAKTKYFALEESDANSTLQIAEKQDGEEIWQR